MAKYRIIHCMYAEKFIEPFIGFLEKNFDSAEHFFLIKNFKSYEVSGRSNTKFLHEKISLTLELVSYFFYLNRAQKIIIHGLHNPRIVFALFLQPWLLKKCYWIMWGGDLYSHKLRKHSFKSDLYERMRSFVIKRIGYFVTYIRGDYELAKKWYGAKGEYLECLMYPSNLYKEYAVPLKKKGGVNILVGNSANPSNNHSDVFEKLISFKDENIMIYCPLSYGEAEYANRIAKLGKELFGNKFIPLLEFMPFEKYLELLGQIDVAVFAHKRQQAMGNTITLLGLGKKVYMCSDVTPWATFSNLGVKLFDVCKFDLEPLKEEARKNNQLLIKNNFSVDLLVTQLRNTF